jgi:hypothetical protein
VKANFLALPEHTQEPIITPAIRKLLALLSACSIAACILAYIYSYSGAPVDYLASWKILLVVGVVVLYLPIFATEYSKDGGYGLFLKRIQQVMPGWVKPCTILLVLIYVGHFLWFIVHTGMGFPEIRDGQHVIIGHGHTPKAISRAEYLALTQAELRNFACLMVVAYFGPMVYWWIRRNQRDDRHGDPDYSPGQASR